MSSLPVFHDNVEDGRRQMDSQFLYVPGIFPSGLDLTPTASAFDPVAMTSFDSLISPELGASLGSMGSVPRQERQPQPFQGVPNYTLVLDVLGKFTGQLDQSLAGFREEVRRRPNRKLLVVSQSFDKCRILLEELRALLHGKDVNDSSSAASPQIRHTPFDRFAVPGRGAPEWPRLEPPIASRVRAHSDDACRLLNSMVDDEFHRRARFPTSLSTRTPPSFWSQHPMRQSLIDESILMSLGNDDYQQQQLPTLNPFLDSPLPHQRTPESSQARASPAALDANKVHRVQRGPATSVSPRSNRAVPTRHSICVPFLNIDQWIAEGLSGENVAGQLESQGRLVPELTDMYGIALRNFSSFKQSLALINPSFLAPSDSHAFIQLWGNGIDALSVPQVHHRESTSPVRIHMEWRIWMFSQINHVGNFKSLVSDRFLLKDLDEGRIVLKFKNVESGSKLSLDSEVNMGLSICAPFVVRFNIFAANSVFGPFETDFAFSPVSNPVPLGRCRDLLGSGSSGFSSNIALFGVDILDFWRSNS